MNTYIELFAFEKVWKVTIELKTPETCIHASAVKLVSQSNYAQCILVVPQSVGICTVAELAILTMRPSLVCKPPFLNMLGPEDSNTIPRQMGRLRRRSVSGPPVTDTCGNGYGLVTHSKPVNPEVDIIFVHGLDGGSFSSWAKNEDPNSYWPKQWLPKEVELSKARIHTYGYNLAPKRDLHHVWDFSAQFLTELLCSPLWFGTASTSSQQTQPVREY